MAAKVDIRVLIFVIAYSIESEYILVSNYDQMSYTF